MPGPPNNEVPPPGFVSDDFDEQTEVGQFDSTRLKIAKSRDRAYLIVLAGEKLGQMFRIHQSETLIGRAEDATISFPDDGVSRRHAKIVQAEGAPWIEDLQSANGTIINGERIQRAALRDGDKIRIGATVILKFTYADELEENFQKAMYQKALRDELTKAYNKRHLLDRLPSEIAFARRHSTPLSLLMIDIDYFKKVNDCYGHPAGDYVLATLAGIIMGALRPRICSLDTVARNSVCSAGVPHSAMPRRWRSDSDTWSRPQRSSATGGVSPSQLASAWPRGAMQPMAASRSSSTPMRPCTTRSAPVETGSSLV